MRKYAVFIVVPILLGLLVLLLSLNSAQVGVRPAADFWQVVGDRSQAEVWQPVPGTSWQWQLQGELDLTLDVAMYNLDLFDTPSTTIDSLHAAGRVVICYFSAGSWEEWRPDAQNFPPDVIGDELDGWPGEKWLDIQKINALSPVMLDRLDLAVEKGCDGVEPDNIDGYTNPTGFDLTYEDQILFNTWLASEAHVRGLSIGLKNDLDQVQDLQPLFDWALNEQCFEFEECEQLLPFIAAGKTVFGVSYSGDPEEVCPMANDLNFDWLFKNIELDAERLSCRESYAEGTETPPPTLPDLSIRWMRIELETGGVCSPSSIQLGLRVTFKNEGAADSGAFSVMANGVQKVWSQGLTVGEEGSLWFVGFDPQLNVVILDSLNEVVELDEGNNSVSEILPIPTLPPTCTPEASPTPTEASTPSPEISGPPFYHYLPMI